MRILLVLAALTLSTTSAGIVSQAQTPRVVEITAERFEFWPPEVKVVEGESIELRLRSDDTLHGFRLAGTSVSVTVPKRGKGIVTATLPRLAAGRYTFECNRMCGAGHQFMRGVLIVAPAKATR